jgi:hypothetical protein
MAGLSEKERALLAGNDAGLWLRLKSRLSGRGEDAQAASQRTEIEELTRLRSRMPVFRELPEHFAWDALAAEMKANILVAVEAGEAVRPQVRHVPVGWKAGLAFAGLAVVMVSGYWWHLPGRLSPAPPLQQAVLEARPGGLEVQDRETAFGVMYARESGQQTLSGGQGSVRADFVDEETGQLTVAHVYME